jgi:hypothetical protein
VPSEQTIAVVEIRIFTHPAWTENFARANFEKTAFDLVRHGYLLLERIFDFKLIPNRQYTSDALTSDALSMRFLVAKTPIGCIPAQLAASAPLRRVDFGRQKEEPVRSLVSCNLLTVDIYDEP